MVDLLSIGQQIADGRRKLKFTQVELARRAGVSRATLDDLLKEDADDESLGRRG